MPSGSVGDTDIYGAQQHIPLMLLEIDPWHQQGVEKQVIN
ncbi:MAG: DUF4387 family protein [Anaerolineales bacterium]